MFSNLSAETKKEIVGYTFVGILGSVVDFAAFYISVYLGLPIVIAQWLGAGLGFLHNHIWHHFHVFNHNRHLALTTSFSLIAAVLGIIISGPLLKILIMIIPNLILSKIIIIGFTAVSLFIIRKKWIFSSKEPNDTVETNHLI